MPQRVEGNIEVQAPVQTVYEYWRNLENLPSFMSNIEEVRSTGPDTTHWVVKGPLGARLEFDARTTQDEPNSAIGWNTVDGDVQTSGQVRFQELGPNQTRLDVTMNYADPPGGKVGEVASRAVANPKVMMEQDLKNFKDIIEGTATPEEVQQRPSAATAQSGAVAFLTSGTGLLVLGGGFLLWLLLRRGGGSSGSKGKSRIIFEF
ncbi:MAG TPA: SRPBCC family protein [Rubrobacter sp.]|nr:SRPBCC family protein [Rubrobacter sp.]